MQRVGPLVGAQCRVTPPLGVRCRQSIADGKLTCHARPLRPRSRGRPRRPCQPPYGTAVIENFGNHIDTCLGNLWALTKPCQGWERRCPHGRCRAGKRLPAARPPSPRHRPASPLTASCVLQFPEIFARRVQGFAMTEPRPSTAPGAATIATIAREVGVSVGDGLQGPQRTLGRRRPGRGYLTSTAPRSRPRIDLVFHEFGSELGVWRSFVESRRSPAPPGPGERGAVANWAAQHRPPHPLVVVGRRRSTSPPAPARRTARRLMCNLTDQQRASSCSGPSDTRSSWSTPTVPARPRCRQPVGFETHRTVSASRIGSGT